MHLLAWVGIGAVVGWGVGRIFQGNGYGPFMDILMGIGGGVVGGFLTRSVGFGGTTITTLVAMISAALVIMLAAYVNGRRFTPVSSKHPGTQTPGDLGPISF